MFLIWTHIHLNGRPKPLRFDYICSRWKIRRLFWYVLIIDDLMKVGCQICTSKINQNSQFNQLLRFKATYHMGCVGVIHTGDIAPILADKFFHLGLVLNWEANKDHKQIVEYLDLVLRLLKMRNMVSSLAIFIFWEEVSFIPLNPIKFIPGQPLLLWAHLCEPKLPIPILPPWRVWRRSQHTDISRLCSVDS